MSLRHEEEMSSSAERGIQKESELDLEYLNFEAESLLKHVQHLDPTQPLTPLHFCRVALQKHLQSSFDEEEDMEDRDHSVDGEDDEEIELSQDVFSFIVVDPFSISTLFALILLCIQLFIYIASIFDAVTDNFEDALSPKPNLGIPRGINSVVFVTQLAAILILFVVQESFWDAIIHLSNFNSADLDPVKKRWYFVSNLIRLVESTIGSGIILILIVRSNNVVDLLKDFTAMTFVSDLDNVAFKLANFEFFGFGLYNATIKVCNERIKRKGVASNFCERIFRINSQTMITFIVTVGTLAFWGGYFVRPQVTNKYLCQKLYIQLGDTINPRLAYFSGNYTLKKGLNQLMEPTIYFQETTNTDKLMLRYCESSLFENGVWIFTLMRGEDECNRDKMMARSSVVEDEERFNILDVTSSWIIPYKDKRLMKATDFFFKCVDDNNQPEVVTQSNFTCENIEVDDTIADGSRLKTRKIGSNFTMLKNESNYAVTSFGKPIFIQENSDEDSQRDIVLYLGKRWAITSTRYFHDFMKKDAQNRSLSKYFETDFYAYFSPYEVDSFSEPVKAYSPVDKIGLPMFLKWYSTTWYEDTDSKEYQVPDPSEEERVTFLCSTCNDDLNPCYYNNTCLPNNTCQCKGGARGILCQNSGVKNGFCNPILNKLEFDYDGGDCCVSTCVNGEDYKCGFEEDGKIYVGFDLCHEEIIHEPWSITDGKAINLISENEPITNVALSPNAQVLVVSHLSINSVFVKDLSGTVPHQRGSVLTNSTDKLFGTEVHLSCEEYAILGNEIHPPTTVAITGENRVYIYDWDEDSKLWRLDQNEAIYDTTGESVLRIHLKSRGNILCIQYESRFAIFRRQRGQFPWINRTKDLLSSGLPIKTDIQHVSISENGFILLGNRTCLVLCQDRSNESCNVATQCYANDIMSVMLSPYGKKIAAIIKKGVDEAEILVYDTHRMMSNMTQNSSFLLNNFQSNDKLAYINEEGNVVFYSDDETHITKYTMVENDKWKNNTVETEEKVAALGISSFGVSLLVMQQAISDHMYGGNQVATMQFPISPCLASMTRYHFTFRLDQSPRDLSWRIILYRTIEKKDKLVIMTGGDYTDPWITISHEVCIPKTNFDYIGIQILDLGLDGLSSESYVGLSANGKVILSEMGTDGYEDEYIVPMLNAGKEDFSSNNFRKYNCSLNTLCETSACNWAKLGNELNYEYSHYTRNSLIFSYPLSVSSDGFIMAIGDHERQAARGQVKIFKYDSTEKEWIQMGEIITGNTPFGHLGYSVSLSANGMIVACGAPGISAEDEKGLIRVFAYDVESEAWLRHGDDITGQPTQGHSISLSADGNILASGAESPNGTKCPVRVYRFSQMGKKWSPSSGCLGGELYDSKSNASYVRMSSDGFTVAVAFPYANVNNITNSGSVHVFQFNTVTEEWDQLGNIINGESQDGKFGLSISISPNGTALAVAGIVGKPVKVFNYVTETQVWKQKGKDIISNSGPLYFYYHDVFLSCLGTHLTVSDGYKVEIYYFSNQLNSWMETSTKLSLENDGQWYKPVPFASSADGITIVMSEKGIINVFKKELCKKLPETCSDKQIPFKFEITTDKFPKDITWALDDFNGTTLVGSQLSEFESDERTYTFHHCVLKPSETTFYTFKIYDTNDDGICCEHGNGTFGVYWNGSKVGDETDFKNFKQIFLPPSTEISDWKFEVNVTATFLKMSIINLRKVEPLSEVVENRSYQKPVNFELPANDCLLFQVSDFSGDREGSVNVYLNDLLTDIVDVAKLPDVFHRPYGNCEGTNCRTDEYLFQVDIATGDTTENVLWTLMKSNGEPFFSEIGNNSPNKQYHFRDCVPKSDCLRFSTFPFDGTAGYILHVNASIGIQQSVMQSIRLNDLHNNETLDLGNCDPDKNKCSDGFMNLMIDLVTDHWPDEFEWELVNQNDDLVASSPSRMPNDSYLHQNICVPSNECLVMKLSDTAEDGGTRIHLQWTNGSFRVPATTLYKKKSIYIGNCDSN